MNKICILTGCSGGIGSSIVEKFSKEGYKVIGIDIKEPSFKFKNFSFYKLDLDSPSIYEEDSKVLENLFSDNFKGDYSDSVLINNAATQILKYIDDINFTELFSTFNINIFAALHMSKLFKKYSKGHRNIINIGSIHSNVSKKKFSGYAASKAALEALSKSLSIECADQKIRVLHINPGAIMTDMLRDGFTGKEEKLKKLKNLIPAGYIPQPQEFSEFIFEISQIKSRYFTGSILEYDGGISKLLSDTDNEL